MTEIKAKVNFDEENQILEVKVSYEEWNRITSICGKDEILAKVDF